MRLGHRPSPFLDDNIGEDPEVETRRLTPASLPPRTRNLQRDQIQADIGRATQQQEASRKADSS